MESKLTYLLTCARVIKDQPTQLFSFMDIFDVLYIPKPAGFWVQTFCIAGKLYVDEKKHIKIETSFIDPTSESRSDSSLIEGEVAPGFVIFSGVFNTIKFTEPGRYYLRVKVDNQEINTENKFFFDVIAL